MSDVTLAYHADWSVNARKRWMTKAQRKGAGWLISPPAPVGDLARWTGALRDGSDGGAVAVGVDLPLGLPRAFAERFARAKDFPDFLRSLATRPAFFEVCATLQDLSGDRPFYPARGLAGMRRAAHAEALGFADATLLSRHCDRATAERPAGAPLFWTLGANQTGKAAISAWRDWLIPSLAADPALRIWPFEGDFLALLAPRSLVVAETYPAEAMRHLGLRLRGSKRRRDDRAALASALMNILDVLGAVPEPEMLTAIRDGFGSNADGEDRFDSLIGVLGVLFVLTGRRPDGIPGDPALRQWEGWVLGQTALPI